MGVLARHGADPAARDERRVAGGGSGERTRTRAASCRPGPGKARAGPTLGRTQGEEKLATSVRRARIGDEGDEKSRTSGGTRGVASGPAQTCDPAPKGGNRRRRRRPPRPRPRRRRLGVQQPGRGPPRRRTWRARPPRRNARVTRRSRPGHAARRNSSRWRFGYAGQEEPRAFSNRSAGAVRAGKFEEALEDAERWKLAPKWGRVRGEAGAALTGLGQGGEAVKAYSAGLAVEPESEALSEGTGDGKGEDPGPGKVRGDVGRTRPRDPRT